nr:hypothetical protein [Flavobacteriaceae bacterium]
MGRLKIHFHYVLILTAITVFVGCQDDDDTQLEHADGHHHLTTQKVDLQEFPEVLNYVDRLTSKERPLHIYPSSNPNASAAFYGEIVLLDVDT